MHPTTRALLASIARLQGTLERLREPGSAERIDRDVARDYERRAGELESLARVIGPSLPADTLPSALLSFLRLVTEHVEAFRAAVQSAQRSPEFAALLGQFARLLLDLNLVRSLGEDGGGHRELTGGPSSARRDEEAAAEPQTAGPESASEGEELEEAVIAGDSAVEPAFAAAPLGESVPAARAPRYANAVLLDYRRGRRLDPAAGLEPGQTVRLRLDIGKLSATSHVTRGAPFPDDRLPRDVDLDVMVSSTDFTLLAGPGAGPTDPNVAHGRFFLPADGGPATSPSGGRFLKFLLRAPAAAARASCRIGYYYRNVLVQSQQLTAGVGQAGGFAIVTDYTMSDDLTDLESVPERKRISVLTNLNTQGVHQVVLRALDAGAGQAEAKTFTVDEETLGKTLFKIREALTARAPSRKRRKRAELEEDLRSIAPHGWTLYSQLPGQHPYMFAALYDAPASYVVQVARPASSGFVVPWTLMYDIPLHDDRRPSLCPLVAQWDDSKPLLAAPARECPFGPHAEDVLCPLGFWGFRYAIEQLSSSESPVVDIPTAADADFVVAETQFEVDLADLADHVSALRTALGKVLPHARLREGKDLQTVRDLLGADLPIVYFYCHGQRRSATDPDTWLAVGKREIITAKDFIGWLVSWLRQKRRVWDRVRPLVFINACHSLAIYPSTLVSYLDAFIGSARAAGVIGTEVKVNQAVASDVAERFFTLFLSGRHSVDAALSAIRFEYLAAGNLVGLVYTPYCWGELQLRYT